MMRAILLFGSAVLMSCDKSVDEPVSAESPARVTERTGVRDSSVSDPGASSLARIHSVPKEKRVSELRLQLMSVDDEDVDLALEEIDRIDDEVSKSELLHELAQDMEGRSEVVRLPMLLAISQDPGASEGMKNTLVADLCREFELSYKPEPSKLAELIEERLRTPGLE